jgi:hypothetical protein
MNNFNNPTKTIISIIDEKVEKTDTNGNIFYILKLNSGQDVFAFSRNGNVEH